MSRILGTIKLTIRMLFRRPISSLVLIATLALGIGINSAIFSVVNSALLRPLPYDDPDALMMLWEAERGGNQRIAVADGNFGDLRERSRSLSGIAAFGNDTTLITTGSVTYRAPVCAVSRDFFPILRAQPVLGRTLAPDEFGEGGPLVAVLSYAFWQSAYGGDEDVLGRSMTIYGDEHVIVGVMPPGFEFPREASIWVDYERYIGDSRTAHNLTVLARLAEGASLEQARSELTTIASAMAASEPGALGVDFDLALFPLHEELVGDTESTLVLLFWIVGVVLLIACGNIAGILLSRTIARSRELAIRQASGATGGHLVRQLLIESAVIGLIGAVVGLLLARWSLSLLNAVVPAELLHSGAIVLDGTVIVFALVLGVVTGLLCGLAPVWRIARRSPIEELRTATGGGSGGGGKQRLGGAFVVGQYAFSLAALAVAGLVVKSLLTLINVDPGYRTEGLVTAEITLPTSPPSAYAERSALINYYREVAEKVAAQPAVESVTYTHALPLSGVRNNGLAIKDGQAPPGPDDNVIYPYYRVVGGNYFQTMGIRLIRGRDFDDTDREGSEPVVVVNQSLATLMWGDEDPIGQRLKLPGLDFDQEEAQRVLTVVGIAADVRNQSLDRAPRPAAYVPYIQHLTRARSLMLVASVSGRTDMLVEPIRGIVRQQDPNIPAGRVQSLSAWVGDSTSEPRFRAGLVSVFAGLALLLALLGVYGVMANVVAQRRREMAIRMTVGADRGDLQRIILGQGLRFVVIGQILGTLAAFALTRLLSGLLYEVSNTDLTVFVLVSVALATVVMLTCVIPSIRASRLDPVQVLREA